MSFQAPLFLLALALIPLVLGAAVLARRRAPRYAVRLPSVPTLAAVVGQAPRWRRVLPTALLCAALAGLAGALARPEATVAVPVERASVVLVTDASGSMRASDVEPTRLDAARDAGDAFLDRVPDELQVGLVGYSDAPNTVMRPTTDHAAVRATLDGLVADGGTGTGDALEAALGTLPGDEEGEQRPPAAVVLLSDGANSTGREPVQVAREAAAVGVPVYTVALGTAAGEIEQPDGRRVAVPPDRRTLERIAATSGGEAFTASDAGQLDRVYERLGSRIGTREETREVTAGFAAAALLLLAGALVSSRRWTGRLP